jgi:hypothetical protein
MPVLRVVTAFAVLSDPEGRVYAAGALVDSSDPVVKGREGHFEPVEATIARRRASTVETATAAPGEKRTRARAAAPAGDGQ